MHNEYCNVPAGKDQPAIIAEKSPGHHTRITCRFSERKSRRGSYKVILSFIWLFVSSLYFSLHAQPHDTSCLKIVFAGDIMGHDAQIEGAWIDSLKGYDYEPTFRYLKPYLETIDIAVANLEVTLAGPPYKGYPQFSSPDSLAGEAKKAGFDILLTANNHALDRGSKGFNRTISVLDEMRIIHAGTYKDKVSRDRHYPLIIEKKGIRLAILNYTYGTNGLIIKPPSVINRIDTMQIRHDIEKAGLADPDYTIVAIHWGIEYERHENEDQRWLAEWMIKKGADAIIGSHPHVIQPVKLFYPDSTDSTIYNPVVYSTGNFVSNQRARYKDGGIMFEMTLRKTGKQVCVTDYNYLPSWVHREDKDSRSVFYIVPAELYLQNPDYFDFPDHIRYKLTQFYRDTREHLGNTPENHFYSGYKIIPGQY
ncbi:MAG: CapA family protein [Bacteroidales bacterium]|nr:CapA family protein [Bacteroidales bacterium]